MPNYFVDSANGEIKFVVQIEDPDGDTINVGSCYISGSDGGAGTNPTWHKWRVARTRRVAGGTKYATDVEVYWNSGSVEAAGQHEYEITVEFSAGDSGTISDTFLVDVVFSSDQAPTPLGSDALKVAFSPSYLPYASKTRSIGDKGNTSRWAHLYDYLNAGSGGGDYGYFDDGTASANPAIIRDDPWLGNRPAAIGTMPVLYMIGKGAGYEKGITHPSTGTNFTLMILCNFNAGGRYRTETGADQNFYGARTGNAQDGAGNTAVYFSVVDDQTSYATSDWFGVDETSVSKANAAIGPAHRHWNILTVRANQASDWVEGRSNGLTIGRNTSFTNAYDVESLYRDYLGAAAARDWDLAVYFAWNRVLTPQECSDFEQYIAQRWNWHVVQTWDPTNLPLTGAPIAYFTAESINASSDVTAGDLTTWRDRSGNARHMTVPSGSTKPAYNATGYNGKPVVQFDGLDEEMRFVTGSDTMTGTMFIVCKGAFDGSQSSKYVARIGSDVYRTALRMDEGDDAFWLNSGSALDAGVFETWQVGANMCVLEVSWNNGGSGQNFCGENLSYPVGDRYVRPAGPSADSYYWLHYLSCNGYGFAVADNHNNEFGQATKGGTIWIGGNKGSNYGKVDVLAVYVFDNPVFAWESVLMQQYLIWRYGLDITKGIE